MKPTRRLFAAQLSAVAIGISLYAVPAFAQETIKIGVLHRCRAPWRSRRRC